MLTRDGRYLHFRADTIFASFKTIFDIIVFAEFSLWSMWGAQSLWKICLLSKCLQINSTDFGLILTIFYSIFGSIPIFDISILEFQDIFQMILENFRYEMMIPEFGTSLVLTEITQQSHLSQYISHFHDVCRNRLKFVWCIWNIYPKYRHEFNLYTSKNRVVFFSTKYNKTIFEIQYNNNIFGLSLKICP